MRSESVGFDDSKKLVDHLREIDACRREGIRVGASVALLLHELSEFLGAMSSKIDKMLKRNDPHAPEIGCRIGALKAEPLPLLRDPTIERSVWKSVFPEHLEQSFVFGVVLIIRDGDES